MPELLGEKLAQGGCVTFASAAARTRAYTPPARALCRRDAPVRSACPPSPCGRLSRPRTTTGPPPHPGGIGWRRAFPPASWLLKKAAGLKSGGKEAGKVKAGDEVNLQVWHDGASKSYKVKTVAAEGKSECCASKEAAVKTVAAEAKKEGCCSSEAKTEKVCKEGTDGCTGDGKNGCCGGCEGEKKEGGQ